MMGSGCLSVLLGGLPVSCHYPVCLEHYNIIPFLQAFLNYKYHILLLGNTRVQLLFYSYTPM